MEGRTARCSRDHVEGAGIPHDAVRVAVIDALDVASRGIPPLGYSAGAALRLYSVRFITTSPSSVLAATLSGTRSASSLSHTVNVRVGRGVSGEKSGRARYDSPANRIARRLPIAEPMVSWPA